MKTAFTGILVCMSLLLPQALASSTNEPPSTSDNPGGISSGEDQSTEAMFDMSIEELMNVKIMTVSRVEEDLDDAPGAVYVITRDMIRERGYSSLKEALQVVPGFSVFHRDLDFVGAVRGLAANDNEKFTLLINGVEMNQMNEPDFLNGPINLDNVDRIEVVVGPSSIFMPANTLVATVNVITREMDGLEAVLAGGNNLSSMSLMGGKTWSDRRQVTVSGTLEERRGFDAWDVNRSVAPMTAFAGTDTTGKSTVPNHFIVASGRLDDWSVQLVSYQSRFVELRLGGATLASLDTDYLDAMHGGTLKHEHAVSDTLSTISTFTAVQKRSVRSKPTHPWQHLEQVDYNGEFGLRYQGIRNHLIQTGVQGIYEDNGDCFFDDDGNTKQIFFDKNTWGVGVYVDDTYQFNDKWSFVGGVRADRNTILGEDSDWYWGGRAAAIFRANDKWTTKWIYNQSVRMPSPLAALNDIWGNDVPSAPSWGSGSPNAEKPEELRTVEWTNIFYHDRGRLSATVYYQELDHFITWGAPHTNVGDYSGYGVELDIQHKCTDTLLLWGNGTYINSEFNTYDSYDAVAQAGDAHRAIDDENRLIGAPSTTINCGFDWDILSNVVFTSALRYFTDQPVEMTNDGGATTMFSHINNVFYLDATLLFKDVLRKGWDIQIAGKNILGNDTYVAGPWLTGEYRPRGATLEIRGYLRF